MNIGVLARGLRIFECLASAWASGFVNSPLPYFFCCFPFFSQSEVVSPRMLTSIDLHIPASQVLFR